MKRSLKKVLSFVLAMIILFSSGSSLGEIVVNAEGENENWPYEGEVISGEKTGLKDISLIFNNLSRENISGTKKKVMNLTLNIYTSNIDNDLRKFQIRIPREENSDYLDLYSNIEFIRGKESGFGGEWTIGTGEENNVYSWNFYRGKNDRGLIPHEDNDRFYEVDIQFILSDNFKVEKMSPKGYILDMRVVGESLGKKFVIGEVENKIGKIPKLEQSTIETEFLDREIKSGISGPFNPEKLDGTDVSGLEMVIRMVYFLDVGKHYENNVNNDIRPLAMRVTASPELYDIFKRGYYYNNGGKKDKFLSSKDMTSSAWITRDWVNNHTFIVVDKDDKNIQEKHKNIPNVTYVESSYGILDPHAWYHFTQVLDFVVDPTLVYYPTESHKMTVDFAYTKAPEKTEKGIDYHLDDIIKYSNSIDEIEIKKSSVKAVLPDIIKDTDEELVINYVDRSTNAEKDVESGRIMYAIESLDNVSTDTWLKSNKSNFVINLKDTKKINKMKSDPDATLDSSVGLLRDELFRVSLAEKGKYLSEIDSRQVVSDITFMNGEEVYKVVEGPKNPDRYAHQYGYEPLPLGEDLFPEDPTREGKMFMGWFMNKPVEETETAENDYDPGEEFTKDSTFTKSQTVYAHFSDYYTIKFMDEDGENQLFDSIKVPVNNLIENSKLPKPDNIGTPGNSDFKIFSGWKIQGIDKYLRDIKDYSELSFGEGEKELIVQPVYKQSPGYVIEYVYKPNEDEKEVILKSDPRFEGAEGTDITVKAETIKNIFDRAFEVKKYEISDKENLEDKEITLGNNGTTKTIEILVEPKKYNNNFKYVIYDNWKTGEISKYEGTDFSYERLDDFKTFTFEDLEKSNKEPEKYKLERPDEIPEGYRYRGWSKYDFITEKWETQMSLPLDLDKLEDRTYYLVLEKLYPIRYIDVPSAKDYPDNYYRSMRQSTSNKPVKKYHDFDHWEISMFNGDTLIDTRENLENLTYEDFRSLVIGFENKPEIDLNEYRFEVKAIWKGNYKLPGEIEFNITPGYSATEGMTEAGIKYHVKFPLPTAAQEGDKLYLYNEGNKEIDSIVLDTTMVEQGYFEQNFELGDKPEAINAHVDYFSKGNSPLENPDMTYNINTDFNFSEFNKELERVLRHYTEDQIKSDDELKDGFNTVKIILNNGVHPEDESKTIKVTQRLIDKTAYNLEKKKLEIIGDGVENEGPPYYKDMVFNSGAHGNFGEGENEKDILKYKIHPDFDMTKEEKHHQDLLKVDVGYSFSSWAYSEDTNTYTAQYTAKEDVIEGGEDVEKPDGYVTVIFESEHSELTGTTSYHVNPEANKTVGDLTKPTVTNVATGWKFLGTWDKEDTKKITEDLTINANFEQVADVIVDDTPETDEDRPNGYISVTFLPGENGTLSGNTKYYVNPKKVTDLSGITEPTITPNTGYDVADSKWDPAFAKTNKVVAGTDHEYTAQYTAKEDVIVDDTPETDDDKPAGYVTIKFLPGENGSLEGTTKYYVNPENVTDLSGITEPTIKPNTGYDVAEEKWNPAFKATNPVVEGADQTYTAQYTAKEDVIVDDTPETDEDRPNGYISVTFLPGENGTLKGDTKYYVNPKTQENLVGVSAPLVTPVLGEKFTGWSPEFSSDINHNGLDQKFVAQYSEKPVVVDENPNDKDYVKVTFVPENESTNIEKYVLKGKSLRDAFPPNPEKSGYKFESWNTKEDGTGKTFNASTEVSTEITVYAQYSEKPVVVDENPDDEDYVKVTFIPENESTNIEKYVLKGKSLREAFPPDPEKSGYKFESWNTKEDGTGKTFNASTEVSTEITVYAQYSEKPVVVDENPNDKDYVKVTFVPENESTNIEKYVLIGESIGEAFPSNPEKSGYKFESWNTKEDGTGKTFNPTTEVSTEITVYAQYTKVKDILPGENVEKPDGYVTVTFVVGEGGALSENTVYYVNPKANPKKTVGELEKPTVTAEEGYTFRNWSISDDVLIIEDLEILAEFDKNIIEVEGDNPPEGYYRVIFESGKNGKFKSDDITEYDVKANSEFPETKAPEVQGLNGYSFIGWDVTFPIVINENKTINATYKAPTEAELYNGLAKATVEKDKEFKLNNLVFNPELPEGATFDGNVVIDTSKTGEVKGNVLVTFEDKSTKLVPYVVTVTEPELEEPEETEAEVYNGSAKATVEKDTAITKDDLIFSPSLPDGSIIIEELNVDTSIVGEKVGTIKVKFSDDSEKDISYRVTVIEGEESEIPEEKSDNEKYPISELDEKVRVENPNNLTEEEKEEVKEAIKSQIKDVNIEDENIVVDNDGSVTVIYNDGTINNLKPSETVIRKGREPKPIEPKPEYRPEYNYTGNLDWLIFGTDDSDNSSFEKPVEKPELSFDNKGYIKGYPDGTVRPDGEITRAEAAAMIARLLELPLSNTNPPSYSDTSSGWYNEYINAVTKAGIMKGYPNGTFRPDAPITRGEFATMLSNFDKANSGNSVFNDVKGHWAEDAIGKALENGRVIGYPDGTFRPDGEITRAEAATILNRTFDRSPSDLSDYEKSIVIEMNDFVDITPRHWGFYELMEAVFGFSTK